MRVLIAVEDEIYAKAIVDFVAAHRWQPGTIFKIVHAVEPSFVGDRITAVYGADLQNELLRERTDYGQRLVAFTKETLQSKLDASPPIETNVSIGRAHYVILDVAQAWKADMILLGSHGRTGFSKFLLGSVSMAVLSHADTSCVIVRLPARAKEESSKAKEEARPVVKATAIKV
ncbi:MAG TPA: universal stress protein [Candidatus Obscuribacterales bacterium]